MDISMPTVDQYSHSKTKHRIISLGLANSFCSSVPNLVRESFLARFPFGYFDHGTVESIDNRQDGPWRLM